MPKHFDISRFIARLATRHAPLVLLLALAVTAASWFAVRDLRVRANLVALLPESLPHVQNLQKLIKKTGGFGDVIVLSEGSDADTSARYFKEILPKIRRLPWVRSAAYQLETEAFKPFAALYMDLKDLQTIRERIERRLEHETGTSLDDDDRPPKLDFGDIEDKYEKKRQEKRQKRLFRSSDGRIVALRIVPRGGVTSDLSFGRRILGDVRHVVSNHRAQARKLGLTITVAGKFWNRVQDYQAVMRDVRTSALWGGTLILLLITLYFRQALAFPLILMPLCMSLMWTFALTKLFVGDLNVITAFLFIILLGLGIDFGIHLFARYKAERLGGKPYDEAVETTVRHTGRACLTSALTTSAAFFSLLVTDFKGFSQFGFIAGLGVALAFTVMVVVLPALLVGTERIRLLRIRVRDTAGQDPTASRSFPRAHRVAALVVLFGLGLAVAGGVAAATRRIDFQYDFNKLNTLPPEVTRVKKKAKKVFKLSTDAAVVFVEDLHEAAALERSIRAHMKRDRTPTIQDVRSLLTLKRLLPKDQSRKLREIAVIKKHLKKRAIEKAVDELKPKKKKQFDKLTKRLETRRMTLEDLPGQVRRPFYGLPGVKGTILFIYNTKPLKDARYAARFVEDTRRFKTAKRTYYPASEAVVYAETIQLLQTDGVIAVGAALLTVLLLLLFDFRSLKHTLIVFLPLAAAVCWLLFAMWLVPIHLNMYNLVVLPSIIGLGIDNSVHLYHRYRELGPGGVPQTLRTILGPITATTLTTMVGFGGMISAYQAGLRSIGVLAVLGMGFSLLSVATFLPALLLLLEARKKATP